MTDNCSESYSWLSSDPLIQDVLRCTAEITQLSSACIARIEDGNWTVCAVYGKSKTPYKTGDQIHDDTILSEKLSGSNRTVVMGSIIRQSFGSDNIISLRKDDRALISVPINCKVNNFVGVLYAQASRQQKIFEDSVIRTLMVFAELISRTIDAHHVGAVKAESSIACVDALEIREQLVTILSHDLRMPLHAIGIGTHILLQRIELEENREILKRIDRSTKRITKLVDNISSFAYGRLGHGIPSDKAYYQFFSEELKNVVDELRQSYPGRIILQEIDDTGAVYCDIGKIAQMLSNLGANALKYSSIDTPVKFVVSSEVDVIRISVMNYGAPIPSEVIPHLFKPYWRAAHDPSSTGLGLGLYIVHEVVKAHCGTIDIQSAAETGTTFTVIVPRDYPMVSVDLLK
jgi:signal transduction histidine kinase